MKVVKNEFRTDKSGLKYAQILGAKVNITSTEEVLKAIDNFWVKGHKFSLVTANPELMVMADGDKELREIVNSADLVIPDGVGLRLAIPALPIIKGRKLFLKLNGLIKEKNRKAFFLGGKKIANVVAGPNLNQDGEPISKKDKETERKIVKKINKLQPDLLFVGFGMPKQEKWIARNLPRLKIGGAMAVGGTFDYIFGQAKMPPAGLEKAGLEWLWRLACQPWRLGRVVNAAIVFPLKVFWYKVRRKRAWPGKGGPQPPVG